MQTNTIHNREKNQLKLTRKWQVIELGDKNINENGYYNCRPHVETLEKKLDT